MNIDELHITNYQEAMKNCQKSLYGGLLITAITYIITAGILGKEGTIPFINIVIENNNSAILILSCLYFFSGINCSFYVTRAVEVKNLISNDKISESLLYFPCFINSKPFYKTMLGLILIALWWSMYLFLGEFSHLWVSILLPLFLSAPYFYSLKQGDKLVPKTNKSLKQTHRKSGDHDLKF